MTVRTLEGARAIAVSTEAAQGAVVSTGPTGSVTINYASGCFQTLGPNQRVRIDEAACAAYGQGGPGTGQSLLADPGFVIGGTAAIGIVGGFILTNRDRGGSDTPASP